MQFVKTDDLKAGMRLAKPIYNKMGILLYDRDIKLSLPVIKAVENFGLIGLYILEPAEPLPPLTREDIEFEQFQTIYMFKLRNCLDQIKKGKMPPEFHELCQSIQLKYGNLDHLINFNQNLRSSDDFMYKHSINTAILVAMLCHVLPFSQEEKDAMVAAALLYGIGYDYVPKEILDKPSFSSDDVDSIQMALEKGYELLAEHISKVELPPKSMTLIEYYIFRNSRTRPITKAGESFINMSNVISVAGQYDQLTAMNVSHEPVSEIMAMQILLSDAEKYPTHIVKALADCIHIVPAGASVDLSNKTKGIVLVENEDEFMKPLILRIDNNQIYDLSMPTVYQQMQIVDIMKTMDNRIAIDENTLKLFKGDKRLTETTNKFKRKASSRRQAAKATPVEDTKPHMDFDKILEEEKEAPNPLSSTVSQFASMSLDDLLGTIPSDKEDKTEPINTDPIMLQTGEAKPSAPKKKKRKLV